MRAVMCAMGRDGRDGGWGLDSQRGDHWRRRSRRVFRHELTIELYMLLVGGLPIFFFDH